MNWLSLLERESLLLVFLFFSKASWLDIVKKKKDSLDNWLSPQNNIQLCYNSSCNLGLFIEITLSLTIKILFTSAWIEKKSSKKISSNFKAWHPMPLVSYCLQTLSNALSDVIEILKEIFNLITKKKNLIANLIPLTNTHPAQKQLIFSSSQSLARKSQLTHRKVDRDSV